MTLYVCATPIGNLGDASSRLVETLRGAEVIACEDTRRTLKLLSHFQIKGPRLVSLHEHNEEQRLAEMLGLLRVGAAVALVSDAGTPALSDPGFRLVRACRREGIVVTVVPGPSAVTAALSISGLPSDRALFTGFLPRSRRELALLLNEAAAARATLVAFDSPRRVRGSLAVLSELAPEAEVAVCRELSKLYEEVVVGMPAQVREALGEPVRGEIVVVVALGERFSAAGGVPGGEAAAAPLTPEAIGPWVQESLRNGRRTREVARELAERTKLSRAAAYELVLAAKRGEEPAAL
ncbi:MAG: 16S rRNA (cytidine(1402)-2'-O)-methyltransferase [Gaiellales bacterium]|nr:16S rRNA (cytidine(1402)-2'-O)-methyltransferase [Gaiellales bacterium]